MEKRFVMFPNEGTYVEMMINLNEFKKTNEFDDCVFGWYKGLYISILKENR